MQTMKWIEMVRLGPAPASPEPSPPATFENDKVRPSARVPLTLQIFYKHSYHQYVSSFTTHVLFKRITTITMGYEHLQNLSKRTNLPIELIWMTT